MNGYFADASGTEKDDARGEDPHADDGYDGWIRKGGVVEYWDGADDPELTVHLPAEVELTRHLKAALLEARNQGFKVGERHGAFAKAAAIRNALGVGEAIDYELKRGGYLSKFDE